MKYKTAFKWTAIVLAYLVFMFVVLPVGISVAFTPINIMTLLAAIIIHVIIVVKVFNYMVKNS